MRCFAWQAWAPGPKLQMAAILTMICERVVETGTIRNFGAPQRAPRLRLARPIRGSCFRNLAHLGFCESGPYSEELRGNLAGMQFANGASFDHLDANRGQNWRHLQTRFCKVLSLAALWAKLMRSQVRLRRKAARAQGR